MAYEDYQRDLDKFKGGKLTERSNTFPAKEQDHFDELRPSQIAKIGGFRRHFVATQGDGSSVPELGGTAESSKNVDMNALAEEIDVWMQNLVFFVDSLDVYDDCDGGGMFMEKTTPEIIRERLLAGQEALPELKKQKKVSLLKASFSFFKCMVATGVLFIPQSMSNSGWAGAVVIMLVSALASTAGILLLGSCHEATGKSYPAMGQMVTGKLGFLISAQIALSQYGFCTCYVAFIVQLVVQMYQQEGLPPPPPSHIVLIVTLIFIPLGWIRRIGKMKITNIIGDVIILVGIGFVSWVAVQRILNLGTAEGVVPFTSPGRGMIFAGTAVFAFEGIALVIPIRESMARPDLFPALMTGMMVFFTVLLTGFGLLGYFSWGPNMQTIVLNELQGSSADSIKILYILAIVCTFPIAISPCFSICEGPLFGHMPATETRKWLKNGFRTALTLLLALIAYSAADELNIVVSIIGSFCCIPLAFIFPAVLHMKIVGSRPWLDMLVAGIGTVMVPVTLYMDFSSL